MEPNKTRYVGWEEVTINITWYVLKAYMRDSYHISMKEIER